ncbi:unnamed protein product [Cylicocyclus nassatus]|uniref:2Fe-2S ferredoxin-type domain-containing protein n=1 Tax=Cylicocyclus nassatus TaxID=53992 RepID=A0AA36HCR3_CYLNA|nr:unnamed protein product [Cylicocyclus nassatus]
MWLATRTFAPLSNGRQLLSIASVASFNFACPLSNRPLPPKTRRVEYNYGGRKYVGIGKLGDTLLDVVLDNEMPFIGFGSCGGNCACSTCHVILTPEHFKRVDRINPASEEENDLLDEAPELTDYSRLACQVPLDRKDPETLVVKVPLEKADARIMK